MRQAREALEREDYRRAIQLSEQVRSNERVSDAQLIEIFGMLGRAHVGVGEHQAALSFLKRAEDDAKNLAAARTAYTELSLPGDPAAHFEQAVARRARRRRARIGGFVAGLVALPFLAGCCFCTYPCVGAMWQSGELQHAYEEAAARGDARGRAGTVGDCERDFLVDLVPCVHDESAELLTCVAVQASMYSCLAATSGWSEYCADVPHADMDDPRARVWAHGRCDAFATARSLEPEFAQSYVARCEAYLMLIPSYCADPAMRPADYGGYDEYEDY